MLHDDQFNCVFLFDHISGHANKQVNGKDATKMKKIHGGRLQHPTLIKEKKEYLWSFRDPNNTKIAQVGKEKLLNWYGEPGPYGGPLYLTPSERLAQWGDQRLLLVPRKLTKKELIDEIVAKNTGEPTTNHSELTKKDEKSIKKITKKLKIPFSEKSLTKQFTCPNTNWWEKL